MKIAQIVITETKDGQWKLTLMSLKQVEEIWVYNTMAETLEAIAVEMAANEWEQLSL